VLKLRMMKVVRMIIEVGISKLVKILNSIMQGEDRMKSLIEIITIIIMQEREQTNITIPMAKLKTNLQFTSKKVKLTSKSVTCNQNAALWFSATLAQIPI
jgi:hypothetical protein